MPSAISPGHRDGPDSKASAPKNPAQRGCLVSQSESANRVKLTARIGLPAVRDMASKPGSSARKNARMTADLPGSLSRRM